MTNCSVQMQTAFMAAALIVIIWVALEAYRKMFEGATDPGTDTSQTTVVQSTSLSWWQRILIFFGIMKAPEKDTTIIVNNNTAPGQPVVMEDRRSTVTGADNSRLVASSGDVTPNPQATANANDTAATAAAAANDAAQATANANAAAKAVADAKTAAEAKAAADLAATVQASLLAAQKAAADALAKISVKSIIFKSPITNEQGIGDWRSFGFSKVVIYTKDGAQMPQDNIQDITDINYGSSTDITMANSSLCYLRNDCSDEYKLNSRQDIPYSLASSGPTYNTYNTLDMDKPSGIKFVFKTPIVISKIDLYNHHYACDQCPRRLNGVTVELYSDEASTIKIGSFKLTNFTDNRYKKENVLAQSFTLNSDNNYTSNTPTKIDYPYPSGFTFVP